jgi:indole-3-glycerol phosphate synthase
MTDILSKIAARSAERVKERKKLKSQADIEREAKILCVENPEFPFEKAINKKEMTFICEVKKASPSKGILDQTFPYLKIAGEYEDAGADAISVLTEPDWFLGSDEILKEIRSIAEIPILRKDFTVESYQIYEAKILGADAILLICSLLDPKTLREFLKIAHELGLSALVEAHTEAEVLQALEAGARLIGVNNRDLRTFEVDLTTSIKLRGLVPENILFVSESGIKSPEDVKRLKESKVNGVLIGEALMKSKDKKKQLALLRGGFKG